MIPSVCFIDFVAPAFGLFQAGQTIVTASVRASLKAAGIPSMIHIDEALPSLNDLVEDILSIADRQVAFRIDERNSRLVEAVITKIFMEEELEIVVFGEQIPQDLKLDRKVTVLTAEDLPSYYCELAGLNICPPPLLAVAPYAAGILSAHDMENYGLLISFKSQEGLINNRELTSLAKDWEKLLSVVGIAEVGSSTRLINLVGPPLDDATYVVLLANLLRAQIPSSVRISLPISFRVLNSQPSLADLSQVIYRIVLDQDLSDNLFNQLSQIAEKNQIQDLIVDCGKIKGDEMGQLRLLQLSEKYNIMLSLRGTIASSDLLPEFLDRALQKSNLAELPLAKGFIKSWTGIYANVNTNGYIKHVKVKEANFTPKLATYLSEIAAISSSVYLEGQKDQRLNDEISFDEDGVATLSDETFTAFEDNLRQLDTLPTNRIMLKDDAMIVNNLLTENKRHLILMPYSQAQTYFEQRTEQNSSELHRDNIYIFQLKDAEDYKSFRNDAETFLTTHSLKGLPLWYGYLENYCRFLNPVNCTVDRMPRIIVGENEEVYTCTTGVDALGSVGQPLFELTQNCYVRRENLIKERGCTGCNARAWCAKCSELDAFIDDYCDLMRHHTHVIDYVMASNIASELVITVPRFFATTAEDISVSSEKMFNLVQTEFKGSVAPYFPKYSYMFCCNKAYVIWAPTSGKFFNMSREFALVTEMLLKRLSVVDIYQAYADQTSLSLDESETVCHKVFDVLNQAGILYRQIEYAAKVEA